MEQGIPAATTAGGGTLVVWMCIAPILASGLYDVRLSAAVTGVTATDTIDWGVSTDYATTFPAVTGGTAFGSKSASYPSNVTTASFGGHPLQSYTNAGVAAGITYTNGHTGTPGVSMYSTGAQVAGTAATTMQFNYAGTVGLSITAASGIVNPFVAADVFAIILLTTNISGGGATYQSFSADISERPW